MKTQILVCVIVGLFLMMLIPIPPVAADYWYGPDTNNNWTYTYNDGGTSGNGPGIKDLKWTSGANTFYLINIPWILVDSHACGIHSLTPSDFDVDTTGGKNTIQYTYNSPNTGDCPSTLHIASIVITFYLWNTGLIRVNIDSHLTDSNSHVQAHYVYTVPGPSASSSADYTNYGYYYPGTYESSLAIERGLGFQIETSNYLDGNQYGYEDYGYLRVFGVSTLSTSSRVLMTAFTKYYDYADDGYLQVYVNQCNTNCGGGYSTTGQNTNGPWDYDSGESISNQKLHIVLAESSGTSTIHELVTQMEWQVYGHT
jgi:hypothetical protein